MTRNRGETGIGWSWLLSNVIHCAACSRTEFKRSRTSALRDGPDPDPDPAESGSGSGPEIENFRNRDRDRD